LALSDIVEDPKQEKEKVLNNIKELKENGIIDDKQYAMLVVQYYSPNANLEMLFSINKEQKSD
jgi:hypothetical protein